MSVVTGLINNNKVIISADTLLANLQNAELSKNGFAKVFNFELDGIIYLIGAAGLGADLGKFLKLLKGHIFTKETYSSNDFAKEMQLILKNINNLSILIGCNNKNIPIIFRITSKTITSINQENEYLILTPDSTLKKQTEINNYIQKQGYLLQKNPLDFLKEIQRKIAEFDNFRFVNDDFYYNTLSSDNKIEKPKKSDKGCNMS